MNLELSDLLWYLAIGALFFMMVRKGGCCSGHQHKKKNGDKHDQTTHPTDK